jgi:hypothetical protein
MVRKNRLRRAKTSERIVSTRLGSGGAREREDEAPPLTPDVWEICSSRTELSLVTVELVELMCTAIALDARLTLLHDRVVDTHDV